MLLFAQEDSKPLIDFTTTPLWNDDGIPLAVMGILVVFSALLLVVVCISVLPRALNLLTPAVPSGSSEKAVPQSTDVASGLGDDELSDETVAVIAAAVAAVLDRPHRIVHIRGWGPSEQAWSVGGRLKHHHSHRIQPRDRQ